MTNIIIIEDETIASQRLSTLINELQTELNIIAILNSVEQSKNWFQNHPMPDLIFLDIQLNDGYGFDILDEFKEHCPVIFTTAYNEYAIRGFKYNSLDYLLKPIDKKDLQKAVEKFTKQQIQTHTPAKPLNFLSQNYKKRFMVKIGNQYNILEVENIAFFMAENGGIHIHTFDHKNYPIEYTLDQLNHILDPIVFFRINRKTIINIKSVLKIQHYFNSRLILTLQPQNIENNIVSRERVHEFKKWLDI